MADWTQDSISVALKEVASPDREYEAPKSKWDIEDPRKPEEVLGVVKRNKVFMSREIGDVEVIEFVGIDVDGAPVLEAFPSIGLVSVIVGKEIVKLLDLPLVGIVKSTAFQTTVVVSREQPSHSVRIYGDRRLVVFLCEMTSRLPESALDDIVECILDFTHRHKCPMLYSVEGVPKPEKLTLPDGQEIEINLKSGGGGGGGDEDDEEGGGGGAAAPEEQTMVIDDTTLAKLTKREEEKAAKEKAEKEKAEKTKAGDKPAEAAAAATTATSSSSSSSATPDKKKKKPLNRSGAFSPASKRKGAKGKGKDKDDDETEEEEDIEQVATKLFGDKIHYVTTSMEMAEKLRSMGHIPVVDGIISGVTGGILANAPLTDEEVTAILCPSSAIFPDPEAAVRVLKLLGELIPDVDFSKGWRSLEKEGEDLKKLMKGLLSGLDISSLKKSGSIPYGMYQ